MATPYSVEYRRYRKRIDVARIIAVVAFAVCGIGYALCCSYVREQTYPSGVHYGPSVCVRAIPILGFATIACLLVLAGLVGESLLRFWHRRTLIAWELAAAGPFGVLACIAPFAVLNGGLAIYDNIAFDSVAGWLAGGIAVCLLLLICVCVYALLRQGQYRLPAIPMRSTALLLGLAASVMFAIFVPLRAAEAHRQHEIAMALRSLDCRVHYEFAIDKDGRRFVAKDPDYDEDFLAPLTGSDFRHNIVRVDIEEPDSDLADVLTHLQNLPRLKYVVLDETVPAEKIRQIEQALPGCQIRYVTRWGSEYPWAPPPEH